MKPLISDKRHSKILDQISKYESLTFQQWQLLRLCTHLLHDQNFKAWSQYVAQNAEQCAKDAK